MSREQLAELGFTKSKIQTLVARKRLPRVHRCVYAVGHAPLSSRGRWMAAVLARALHPADCARVNGIPVTSLARTYLDVAEVVNHRRLIDALEAAQRQNKLDVGALEAVMARNPGRHGIKPLQAAVAELSDDPPLLQSHLERAFRDLIRRHGLPEPQYNVYVQGELVDAVWPEHRLVVEVDGGWNYHRTKRSFDDDRRRDRKLLHARWPVARFTNDQVTGAPDLVAEELSELLRDGPWPLPAR